MKNLISLILIGIGVAFFNGTTVQAQSNSIKGCITKFFNEASSGNTDASSNYNNCISGGSGGVRPGNPDQDTDAGEPEDHDPDMVQFDMPSLLSYTGISSLPSASTQIVEFENYFAPALQVIRNVNVSGLNEDEALGRLIGYVISNNLVNNFYGNGNFVLYPSVQYGLLAVYARSGNGEIPASWVALGYTLD